MHKLRTNRMRELIIVKHEYNWSKESVPFQCHNCVGYKIVYRGTRLWPPPSPFPKFYFLISDGLARRAVTEKIT